LKAGIWDKNPEEELFPTLTDSEWKEVYQLSVMPGVIVYFRYQNQSILHRIIKRKGDELVIQGDGVVKRQEKVSVADVIGVVRTVIRPSGKPVSTNRWDARVYWKCWWFLRPIRRYLLAIINQCTNKSICQ